MDPEPDIISQGSEPRSWLDLGRAAAGPGRSRSRILLRRLGLPVLGVALLLALVAFVATRPAGTTLAQPPPTTTMTTHPATPAAPKPAPLPTEPRPPADMPPDLTDKVAQMLSGANGITPNTHWLVGSDYEDGFDSVAVYGNLMQGTLTVELACAGTGKIEVWVEDAAVQDPMRENTKQPIDMDCAAPARASVLTPLTGAGFFVKAVVGRDTVAVLGFAASMRVASVS